MKWFGNIKADEMQLAAGMQNYQQWRDVVQNRGGAINGAQGTWRVRNSPCVAGRGTWPSALSRARAFRVYRSEAETLDQKKRTVRRRFSAGRAFRTSIRREIIPRTTGSSFRICDNKLVCNRYRLTYAKPYLAERFGAVGEIEERPRYNIAPTQQVVTVRKEEGKKTRKFTTMRWGLIPSWAKDMSIGTQTLNARSETVTTKPAFRDPILRKRCLIPSDGFYEWQKMGSMKQPYCFEVGEGELFALAGLWDQWESPEGQIIESCSILTTAANSLVADLHDRMPVIVPADKYDVWLDPDVNDFEAIRDILKPYHANLMRRYPVSRKRNNSRIDDAESASPVIMDAPTQAKLF